MPTENFKEQGASKSRGNAPSGSKTLWTEPFNPFHCSAEWHYREMTSRLAGHVHSWGRRLSANSEAFYPSVESISKYFARHRTTVFKALQELVDTGWAEVIKREPGKPVVYRFLDHDDWSKNHPGLCNEKDSMPWEGEGDELGRTLHSVSGGRAKFLPRQMDGLRKIGLDEEQIVIEFRIFLNQNPQQGAGWKRVYFRFRTHLLRVAKSLSETAPAKNSCSDPSRVRDPYPSRGSDSPCSAEATGTRSVHATQVFELSSERVGRGKQTIPPPASQERSHPADPSLRASERGFPPSKPSPTENAPTARRAS